MPVIPFSEVEKHNSKGSCWVVLNGKVYDLTSFLAEHPGGAKVITKWAGKDGSRAFNPIHPSDIVTKLGFDHLLGASHAPSFLLSHDVSLAQWETSIRRPLPPNQSPMLLPHPSPHPTTLCRNRHSRLA